MSLEGQFAYITGGASGIGKALAESCRERVRTGALYRLWQNHDADAKVYISDRDVKEAESLVQELNKSHSDPVAWAVHVEAANWESQRHAFIAAVEQFGRIDYVFPVAGIAEKRSFPNRPHSSSLEFEKPDLEVLDINLNGVMFTISLAVQQFRRQQLDKHGLRGQISIMASAAGLYPRPTIPVYAAAKHALVGFARSFGRTLLEDSITLNAVCPHLVRTSFSSEVFYEKIAPLGLLIPMEDVLKGFEMTMNKKEISAVAIEVAPGGVVQVMAEAPKTNDQVTLGEKYMNERGHFLHEVVKD